MDIQNLIESFSEFKQVKNINRETMMNIFANPFRRTFNNVLKGILIDWEVQDVD